jgi:murein DD-endopeptidase MepM/ murein hydrolase activator NlpD
MSNKNKKKKNKVFSYLIGGLIIILLILGIFWFYNKNFVSLVANIYVSSENPKQGDTVFIKVTSSAHEIVGNFNGQKLFFYKKPISQEWVSFLGIDADENPGSYKILIDTSNAEHLEKGLKVSLADFSLETAIPVPNVKKTGISEAKAINNIRKNDNPIINKVISNFTSQAYFTSPFSSPLEKTTTNGFSFGQFLGFGKNKIQHLGVDLKASEKTDIYAMNDGRVVLTVDLSNYGKTVVIDHGLGIFSMYLHLEKFNVSNGDTVKRGQLIGLSGDTGYVTAPHLHLSIRVDGSRVNPIDFINTTQKLNDDSFVENVTVAFLNIFR